jgi:hypothetical protein
LPSDKHTSTESSARPRTAAARPRLCDFLGTAGCPDDSLVSRFLRSRVSSRGRPGDDVGGLSRSSGVPKLLNTHTVTRYCSKPETLAGDIHSEGTDTRSRPPTGQAPQALV